MYVRYRRKKFTFAISSPDELLYLFSFHSFNTVFLCCRRMSICPSVRPYACLSIRLSEARICIKMAKRRIMIAQGS